jgi:3-isopropylmalate/(R)-2-methylmalate dehydratase large subunit
VGQTIAEKILASRGGKPDAHAGEIVMAKVDCAMMDDILGPRLLDEDFKRLKGKIWDTSKVVIICDHYSPQATAKQADIVKFTRDWSAEKEIKNFFEGIGPCHQILAENGFDIPGTLQVGTDSHTCTAGAFGCFGTGIGTTEMLSVLCTGEIWLRVPESMRIEWRGTLQPGVMAKDIILRTIGDVGHAGATYMAMEFCGDTIQNFCMDERMCISNMAVESGAKAGLITPDATTIKYLENIGCKIAAGVPQSDADATYIHTFSYNAGDLEPQVACPHNVDNVKAISKVQGTPIQRAYLGSCTGGRLNDLRVAAGILKGKKLSKTCRLMVSPASQKIWRQANKEGLLEIFAEAGATILAPTCGACLGVHSGLLAAGEAGVSTTNRNFKGRMGSKDSDVYLASPATLASTAIEGCLADARAYV